VKNRKRLALLALLPAGVILLGALAGCAPGGGGDTGSGGSSDGGSAASGPTCDGVTTEGYELFVDPRLEIDPVADVYSLDAGDSIAFTDTPEEGVFTTYSYSLSYIDDDGVVFPSNGGIFVGAEDTGQWTLDGPITPTGIVGGPYASFVDIEATTSAGTTVIARLCAVLPAS
jgi:hypothetical protein